STASNSKATGRTRARRRLGGDGRQFSRCRPLEVDDFVPREPSRQPSGSSDNGGLAHGVIDRLILVMLAVELKEESEFRTTQIDAGKDCAVSTVDDVLTRELWQAFDGSSKLDHQRLEHALR